MILRACAVCGVLSPNRRCAAHSADTRPNAARRGYDHRWRRTRAGYLFYHPICEEPGCGEPSAEVHHTDGLGPRGPRGHDWTVLQALCKTHHSRITASQTWHEKRGVT